MNLLVNSLSHTYDGMNQPVLHNIELSLVKGEQLLLRGISGSGKTTLLNILAGLLTPTQGTVTINKQMVYQLPEAHRDEWRRSEIGYVFQTHHLIPMLSAWENVAMPRLFAGVSKAQAKRETMDLLYEVGIAHLAKKRPKTLSTGQRQRVAIARALINQPTVILADEPTASLDAENGDIVMDLLQKTCQTHAAILIVSSHDPALNVRFPQIADLNNGQLSLRTGGTK